MANYATREELKILAIRTNSGGEFEGALHKNLDIFGINHQLLNHHECYRTEASLRRQ